MGFLAPMLVLITCALVLGSMVRASIVNRRLRENARVYAELQGKLIEKFGTADEVVRYLASDAGLRLLDGQSSAPTSPHSRVLDAVHLGLILLLGGLGIWVASHVSDPQVFEVLSALGKIAAFLGVGFLASAAASTLLSRRWGLLGPRRHDAVSDAEA
jgi:hypothetical protein